MFSNLGIFPPITHRMNTRLRALRTKNSYKILFLQRIFRLLEAG